MRHQRGGESAAMILGVCAKIDGATSAGADAWAVSAGVDAGVAVLPA